MPLLKSLLCFKGYDNGRRFLLINLACYLLLILFSSVLAQAPVLLVLLLLVCTPVMLASSMRRIHDAGFATPFAAGPVIVFWVCVFGIAYINHGASWTLLILAVLVTLAMTTISNARVRRERSYVWGYSGPINLSDSVDTPQPQHFQQQRIEPTITGGSSELNTHVDGAGQVETGASGSVENHQYEEPAGRAAQVSWEQQLNQWFIANKQFTIVGSIVISLVVVVGIVLSLFDEEVPLQTVAEQPVVEAPKERLNKIEMPDNFWIMLDKNDALTIAWQGDFKTDGELWSAITGKGDKDCFEISFNNRDKFRSMKVTVKNGGDYYADFSPVDTQNAIKAIALRDKFKLCGYEFSLKGTQARLMNNKKYSVYFEE
ncbi:hypothetical protein [Aliikangiella coralliicola]|uniref:DUF805 domain-containing protein n=1 Tax=Aliikangiella coralliicola TaxID=2592383 RepID=A0A545U7N6_9GAMM|nr:hypothetical protein [Aliikangiella coralliicola]TQV85479.1 hypothetical protein FLL46_20150 [Aliikangiella coralliicola]